MTKFVEKLKHTCYKVLQSLNKMQQRNLSKNERDYLKRSVYLIKSHSFKSFDS